MTTEGVASNEQQGPATDEKQAPDEREGRAGRHAGKAKAGGDRADESDRVEGRQNPLIHEGAAADPASDTNEGADDKVRIVEPDGSPSPRADPSSP